MDAVARDKVASNPASRIAIAPAVPTKLRATYTIAVSPNAASAALPNAEVATKMVVT